MYPEVVPADAEEAPGELPRLRCSDDAHRPARSQGTGTARHPGEGQRRKEEPLASRDAVARVLMEAGADLLLRRISPARAGEIERKVDRVLDLFDRVDVAPVLMPVLKRHLDELEVLMRETREVRAARR
ncbi:hypothetical protein [Myxococcus hansupus]|uniref:hypothetical protein n=1 Tax=Pseudomyxococcus hansupus TaxID=1297742 RepID=UPI001D03878F|nr:hypothetical protein [Myxococcus hansupus]